MATGKFISYLRVSTDRQGRSGLGLDAQRSAILTFLNGGSWELSGEYIEIESGKDDSRPKLKEALDACERIGGTLLIAKLDRLSRNVSFIANLMAKKDVVNFVACDIPYANKFTIHILSAVAEHEREMISKRTKEALKAAKARGKRLGNPQGLKREAAERGRIAGMEARIEQSRAFAAKRYEGIKRLQAEGMSLNGIARRLNDEGALTARGMVGAWTARAVLNLIERVEGKR